MSPYCILISGGKASSANLFYNNARRQVGLVGHWDIVAFDEVGGMKVQDPDTIQIMKDYMANGRSAAASPKCWRMPRSSLLAT